MSTPVMLSLSRLLGHRTIVDPISRLCAPLAQLQVQPRRDYYKGLVVPKPGVIGKSYRRVVHYKDKYTIEPLEVTNLGGRDPVSGRKVVIGLGGGIKHKYHWINWKREGPSDINEKPKEEKVLEVFKDGCRTCHVALVGSGKELYYILATVNMKPGNIIRTHRGIPRIPVNPNEGDCYPLGALPVNTQVNCVEKLLGMGGAIIHAAGTYGVITKKVGDRVFVKIPSKREFNLNQHCMATVGRLSNVEHSSIPIGSAQKLRELGYRPRSGLWHRKTGKHGRKIRRLPPPKFWELEKIRKKDTIQLTLNGL